MTTGYKLLDGTDLKYIFQGGTTTQMSGYALADGADLSSIFAPYLNTVAVSSGYKLSDGSDLNLLYNGMPQFNITYNSNYCKNTSDLSYNYYSVTGPINTSTTITLTNAIGKSLYYMAVAGGGAGNKRGGGGAGGMLDGSLSAMYDEGIIISVGAGGTGMVGIGRNGCDTIISFANASNTTIQCYGGGAGGNGAYGAGGNGGSGGGGSNLGVGGGGVYGQGNAGGTGLTTGGGGGGAGATGGQGGLTQTIGGEGGIGRYSKYSGNNLGYAGGGGSSLGNPNITGALAYGGSTRLFINGINGRGGGGSGSGSGSSGSGGSGFFVLAIAK